MKAVTVCIPAYRAATFLGRTIESVVAQTYPHVNVVVSVDPAGDETVAAATRHLKSGRLRVFEQSKRLGWVGNVNAALALADSSHAMILPHDDVIEPTYVAACMAALEAQPDAILAWSDLDFGGNVTIVEESILGEARERAEAFLRGHFDAVAFRGVFDRKRAAQHRVPGFALADYAADTLWIARMLAQGVMVRVPELLYRKHPLDSSVHAAWSRTSTEEMEEMWVVHCCEVRRTLLEAGVQWDDQLEAAWETRLMSGRNAGTAPAPRALDATQPLRPQAEAIFTRLQTQQPHYSWSR